MASFRAPREPESDRTRGAEYYPPLFTHDGLSLINRPAATGLVADLLQLGEQPELR
jgi:hypothetical protein